MSIGKSLRQPNKALGDRPSDRRPLIICGPSGVGKGTLCLKLVSSLPDVFAPSVSHTTRKPRANEVEGINYFFVQPEQFTSLISQNGFVEHTTFNGQSYGTSRRTISDLAGKGYVVILEIVVKGVEQVKADSGIDARYVFIRPPSLEVLECRLRERGTEDEADVQRRLAQATVELGYVDIPGFFDKVIVNDDLNRAYEEFVGFAYS
ncbi:guanylate kinase [Trichophyton rubrum D6]|uniref:guanylate kinase n=2 Tax=Trichophyton TaxID=5550 RepID=A0A022WEN0_TRIRU|nr:guanylate kinase [Trichophyton rubrum MR850]EZF46100.1 guanylate kinase [Trichophyton rubrum CBS 100081]EZF56860.1 guanylate kinase [Trichophyton rubrum CBS 288.86]EZF67545.1 guanylate kinase [Trichophyton rubrum CBS 289.86]EZF78208.1 guanylate kinase [Trichophyton soudanense CBS 452.61]EZF88865.1 guanylate kinase [Trichophyton rubrum MR1448]EZF99566.1 guanylate kinase [Trichophyton rubrum MR1459]EZG10562.1 guanylate kinase [Trichophyton rubrum CBS 735.88]EZG21210.1 guanylate kinase [Tri